jgi:hypothetical protein
MPTGRQTDITKLIVAFRNFANAPKTVNRNICVVSIITWCPNNNLHVGCVGKNRNGHGVLVWNPEGKRALGKPRRRCQDNIKMGLKRNRTVVWT